MKLENWALISQIAGGLAVVATLIVLIIEIRSNTEAISAQTILAQYNVERERRNRSISNSGGILDVRVKVRTGERLTETEAMQFGVYLNDLLDNYEWQFREVSAGRLPEDSIDLSTWQVMWQNNDPGLPELFDANRATLDPEFIRFMETNVIGKAQPTPGFRTSTRW